MSFKKIYAFTILNSNLNRLKNQQASKGRRVWDHCTVPSSGQRDKQQAHEIPMIEPYSQLTTST